MTTLTTLPSSSSESTTSVTPIPGSPEYDAANVSKFETVNQPSPQTTQRPSHIPEKFWDVEKGSIRVDDLVQSYTELEKSRGSKQDADTGVNAQDNAEKTASALNDIGLDYNRYVDHYMETGELSEAHYAEMAAKNIPRSIVDAHIATQVALAEKQVADIRSDVFSSVGGEDKFQAMVNWAKTNLSPQELKSYNQVVESYDIGQIKLAVQGVHSKWIKTVGEEPNLIKGKNDVSGGDVYRSVEQLTQDMKDPRYDKDPAYRAAVSAKLQRSSIM